MAQFVPGISKEWNSLSRKTPFDFDMEIPQVYVDIILRNNVVAIHLYERYLIVYRDPDTQEISTVLTTSLGYDYYDYEHPKQIPREVIKADKEIFDSTMLCTKCMGDGEYRPLRYLFFKKVKCICDGGYCYNGYTIKK